MPRRDNHGGLTGPPAWITYDHAARSVSCTCGKSLALPAKATARQLAAQFTRDHNDCGNSRAR